MYRVLMPQLGLTMEEGTVSRWVKQEGDLIKNGDVLVEIETDKLTSEVVCEYEGTLLKIVAQEGDDVPVKGLLCLIGQQDDQVNMDIATATPLPEPLQLSTKDEIIPVSTAEGKRIHISPLARNMAFKLGVDYTDIAGTGTSGRITRNDILTVTQKQNDKRDNAYVPQIEKSSAVNNELMAGDTVTRLSSIRKIVAQRMSRSFKEIPSVTQTTKVDVTELLKLRKKLLDETEIKYSVNDLILKSTAKVLRQHPEMLVSYYGEQVIHRAHINIGMAVALEEGLIVPVIRDADAMSLEQLSIAAKNLAERAKANKLTSDECKDSTFTISNLGMFGVDSFTPIINQPDAAILGVCAVQDELVMDNNCTVTKRQMMRLCVTYDHRLLDGVVAAEFAVDLRDTLQNPLRIIL